MPHVLVEHSNNIIEKDLHPLFEMLHQLLSEHLPAKIESCKTRSQEYAQFYLGDGQAKAAFVHVGIKIMPGRSDETLNHVSQLVLGEMKKYFSQTSQIADLHLSVSINLIGVYAKELVRGPA